MGSVYILPTVSIVLCFHSFIDSFSFNTFLLIAHWVPSLTRGKVVKRNFANPKPTLSFSFPICKIEVLIHFLPFLQ